MKKMVKRKKNYDLKEKCDKSRNTTKDFFLELLTAKQHAAQPITRTDRIENEHKTLNKPLQYNRLDNSKTTIRFQVSAVLDYLQDLLCRF